MRRGAADISAERTRTASRRRVLDVVRSASAGCDVHEVAGRTGLHPNTVRFHLDRLESEGLVSRHVRRSGKAGRPPLTYVANPVPDAERERRDFGRLAEILAQIVRRTTNRDPVDVAVETGRSWGLSRAAVPATAAKRAAPVAELTAALDELGFAPEVSAQHADGHLVILQRHCPFLEVALSHQDVVCSVHLGLVRGILEQLKAPANAERLVPFAGPAGCELHVAVTAPPGPPG